MTLPQMSTVPCVACTAAQHAMSTELKGIFTPSAAKCTAIKRISLALYTSAVQRVMACGLQACLCSI